MAENKYEMTEIMQKGLFATTGKKKIIALIFF